ncbi:MAG: hypothetical protein IPL75_14650 [Acidobacteria bacterium]|nr:hypothetical protein [Acidobacteriota bacterium]
MRTTSAFALVSGTLILAVAVACSQPGTQSIPSPTAPASDDLGPGGSTLKVPAPTLQSPANNQQVTTTTNISLVSTNVSGTNISFPVTLEYEVRLLGSNPAGTLIANPKVPQSSGATTTWVLPNQLDTSALYTWRVRATYSGAFGPWSSTFTFKAPDIPPSYIRGNEIFDSLTDGKTVGTVFGNVQWLPGVGVKLLDQTSRITYTLPTTLTEGTFSMMVKGVDESNPGDKSKIMSMQENGGDITSNDYRMTAELRGRAYVTPGAVQARIITGDAGDEEHIHDTPRIVVDFNDEEWYLWRCTWRNDLFTLEVRRGGPNGQVMYSATRGTSTRAYRPIPHVIHIGAPVGRAGAIDATAAGMIAKNLWVSPLQTRPQFPFPDVLASPSARR